MQFPAPPGVVTYDQAPQHQWHASQQSERGLSSGHVSGPQQGYMAGDPSWRNQSGGFQPLPPWGAEAGARGGGAGRGRGMGGWGGGRGGGRGGGDGRGGRHRGWEGQAGPSRGAKTPRVGGRGGEDFRADLYYNRSMMEDPWK